MARGLPLSRGYPQPPHDGQEVAAPGDDGELLREADADFLDEWECALPRGVLGALLLYCQAPWWKVERGAEQACGAGAH